MLFDLIASFIKAVLVFAVVMSFVPFLIWLERKLVAWMQQRIGPNRTGPFGLLQPIADAVKLIIKENIFPSGVEKITYFLAPMMSMIPALAAFAVIPFGSPVRIMGRTVNLQVADVNVAVLVIFAITSISVYGIVLAGWSSNSKYSLLGALRSASQMISYELSYGVSLASVLIIAGSLSLTEIVDAQQGAWLGVLPRWNVFVQPVGFLVFMIAGVAETNRAPFDLPEAEQELVAGYHTEYSSTPFMMFFLAEYINMVTAAAVAANLFLGGWHGPFLPESLGWIWFLAKTGAILFFYIWMRWTLPRLRYDQLMQFGWKVLLPVAALNLILTAAGVITVGR